MWCTSLSSMMYNQRKMQLELPLRTSSESGYRNQGSKIETVRPHTSSADSITSRMDDVRSQLQFLKEQVHRQKLLLKIEQEMVYTTNENARETKTINRFGTPSNCKPYLASTPTTSEFKRNLEQPLGVTVLTGPSRKHLEDIEMQCDKELMKLEDYISNISQLKAYWREATLSKLYMDGSLNAYFH